MTTPPSLIRRFASGVPGFDAVLGGGVPEFSFNLLTGGPGAGKTTLAQQILFANATAARPGLYFTVLGEPTIKMIRYQQQYGFFDVARVGRDIQLLNLSEEASTGDLDAVLGRIAADVERLTPGLVVVDSFGSLGPMTGGSEQIAMKRFAQQLALFLTTWEATSFLISEYAEDDERHPVFTVADGIMRLSQVTDRNSVVRKLQVMKVRGQAFMPGLHTYRITDDGLLVYPRIPAQQAARKRPTAARIPTGVPGLDEMMGGGIPAGDAVMIAGPSGTGKTTFATQFIAQSNRDGEAVVMAVFEEYPEAYMVRAKGMGVDLARMVADDLLQIIYLRPLDLSVDETLAAILDSVQAIGATRVVIDSISGFEIALAPAFREDFRESFYRLVGALTALGVTVVMTNEIVGVSDDMSFTGERVSFMTDDIVVHRYVEMDGELRTVLSVVKMRGSAHSHDFREFTITEQGAVVGQSLEDYQRIMTGYPELRAPVPLATYAGLTASEAAVLDALVRLRGASVSALATRTGLPQDQVEQTLARLVRLDFASDDATNEADGAREYRAVAKRGTP